jgi:alanine racemase
MKSKHETLLYINLKTLEENYNYIKSQLPSHTKIIAVVKAFAYGLGDVKIASHLEQLGVDTFWVADFDEGIQLRKGGITSSIIVANPGYKSLDLIFKYQLEPVIYNLRLLNLYCSSKESINIHIKINSGMNRYGFDKDDLPLVLNKLQGFSNITVKSICSHLSCTNDPKKDEFSQQQIKSFDQSYQFITQGLDKDIPRHILNSNGALRFSITKNEWVRLGISLYGGVHHEKLKQIFSLKSTICQIRNIQAGQSVGYQNSFLAQKDMKMAIIPVGYADGLNRKLGHQKGQVLINDAQCCIIGEISMDSFAADVSHIDAIEGDEVIIFSPKYSVSLLAEDLDTIPYEIMATLNRRIKRLYLKE